MSADRLHLPPWYRPPDNQEETETPSPAAGSPPVAVDAPHSWVRPAPIYYHDAPDAVEVSAARTVPLAQGVLQAPSLIAPQPAVYPQPAPAEEQASPSADEAREAATAAAEARPAEDVTPAQPATTAASRRISRRLAGALLLGGVLVVAIVVIAARLGGSQSTAHRLALPQSVGSLPLIGDTAAAAQQALNAEAWTEVAAGGYGNGAGQLLLIVGRPPASAPDAASVLTSLQAPLVQQGFVFNVSTASTSSVNGATYTCGPASAATGQLDLCVWYDGDTAGVVVDYSGATLAQVRAQAETARATAEH